MMQTAPAAGVAACGSPYCSCGRRAAQTARQLLRRGALRGSANPGGMVPLGAQLCVWLSLHAMQACARGQRPQGRRVADHQRLDGGPAACVPFQ